MSRPSEDWAASIGVAILSVIAYGLRRKKKQVSARSWFALFADLVVVHALCLRSKGLVRRPCPWYYR